ncbi:MAG: hypothetical protein COV51_00840, partial [Gallionellaceae bacterium CG11_big_fil_rev_8_21_14_0_20_60_62]
MRAATARKQAEVRAQAVHATPFDIDLAMQQAALLEAVRRHIGIVREDDGETAEDGVAVVPRLVHRVHAVGVMQPER